MNNTQLRSYGKAFAGKWYLCLAHFINQNRHCSLPELKAAWSSTSYVPLPYDESKAERIRKAIKSLSLNQKK